MKVLVIGSGGREHALAWAISKSEKVDKLYCLPGNAGTEEIAENVNIDVNYLNEIVKFAKEKNIDLTVVGPEAPLVSGIVDLFENENLRIFGPNRDAAQLEGSKSFTKNLLMKNNVPTASFEEFTDSKKAKEYIREKNIYPIVIKADGLAAGKGVVIAKNFNEAEKAIDDIMEKKIFKEAGEKIVIEDFLEGEEASILGFTDSETILTLPPSQDHKKIYDGDKGPNTGGMGAYAPTPVIDKELEERIKNEILIPTIDGLKREGIIYKGILYAGLMITKEGPKVLEYNVRFGDPETQSVLPLLKTDIVDLFMATINNELKNIQIETNSYSAVCVVLASEGYPGKYEKGKVITGLENFKNRKDIIIFHAGTKKDNDKIITSGGRVLNIVGLDKDILSAIKKVYSEIDRIKFENVYYRKDIGKKAEKFLK